MKKQFSVFTRFSLLVVTLLSLFACALPPAGPDPFTTMPYGHKVYDLHFAWDAKRQGDELMLQGALKNVMYPAVQDLDITFELKDSSGSTIRKAHSYVIPSSINMDDTANFDIKISLKGASPDAYINFIYFYTSINIGRAGAMPQLNSFRIDQFGRFLPKP